MCHHGGITTLPSPEDLRSCLTHPRTTIPTAAGPCEYADRGSGEPLLAVHGTLGGCDQGLVAAEFFRVNGYRVIAPSRPGYLGTPLATGRTPTQQGDALAALLDELGIEGIQVMAGSGGGPAAYALAGRHPDLVTRLLQVDALCLPTPPFPLARISARDPVIRLQLWLLRHATLTLLKTLFRRFGRSSAREAAERAAAIAADPGRVALLEAILLASSGCAGRRAGFDNDSELHRWLPLSELGDISCPTLIMHATEDASVPPDNAVHAHREIAGSELHWMRGSHVAFFLEESDTAPEYALAWLRGGNPAGRAGRTGS